jgi:hypothetical protein
MPNQKKTKDTPLLDYFNSLQSKSKEKSFTKL